MFSPNSIPDLTDKEPRVGQRVVMYLSGDCMRLLEDELWAELSTDILMGWKSHEQATDEFMAWRAGYKVIEAPEVGKDIVI